MLSLWIISCIGWIEYSFWCPDRTNKRS